MSINSFVLDITFCLREHWRPCKAVCVQFEMEWISRFSHLLLTVLCIVIICLLFGFCFRLIWHTSSPLIKNVALKQSQLGLRKAGFDKRLLINTHSSKKDYFRAQSPVYGEIYCKSVTAVSTFSAEYLRGKNEGD